MIHRTLPSCHPWLACCYLLRDRDLLSRERDRRLSRSRLPAGASAVKGWPVAVFVLAHEYGEHRQNKRKPSQSRSRSLSRRSLSGLFRSLRSRSSRPDMPKHAQSWRHTALASPGSFPTRSTLSLSESPVCLVCFGGSILRTRRCPNNFRAQAAQACPGTGLHQAS